MFTESELQFEFFWTTCFLLFSSTGRERFVYLSSYFGHISGLNLISLCWSFWQCPPWSWLLPGSHFINTPSVFCQPARPILLQWEQIQTGHISVSYGSPSGWARHWLQTEVLLIIVAGWNWDLLTHKPQDVWVKTVFSSQY